MDLPFFFGGKMELWHAASLFFSGAFSYWVIAKIMDLGHLYNFVKETTDSIVMILISCSQDVAFIKKMKYETMETMAIDEEQIKLLKKIDEETFNAWRDMAYLKMLQVYPKQYKKILSGYDWSKITKSVDELYK